MLAGFAGDEIVAVPDARHAPEIQLPSPLLAGRAGEAVQPLRDVRIGLMDRFGGGADLESVVAVGTLCGVEGLGVTLIAARIHYKAALFANWTRDLRQSFQDLFDIRH